ncbi:nuclear transport factor 2 family protein [Yoonia sp. 2307UL14-13]|uniref:nuclear transport factor 2 family protein n=1 Tax=Yoonia sp. 2307UL14-13 TaxID=3126506 RepID=UPI0030B55B23
MDQKTFCEIRALEESLWRAETRFDDGFLKRVLAEDFVEFGWSGRTYRRSDLIGEGDIPGIIDATLSLRDFTARYLSEDVVLVTCVSEDRDAGRIRLGKRSSIWIRAAGRWQLRFHQATPTTGDLS